MTKIKVFITDYKNIDLAINEWIALKPGDIKISAISQILSSGHAVYTTIAYEIIYPRVNLGPE